MNAFAKQKEFLEFGETVSFRNLSITPILGKAMPEEPALKIISLEKALADEKLKIGETGDGSGSVPELEAENNGDEAVLILDGEELQGGKQNRMVNATILVAPHSRVKIPVSCIESGRWSYGAYERWMSELNEENRADRHRRKSVFRSASRLHHAHLRARKAASVNSTLAMSYLDGDERNLARRYRSDQGEVWSEVGESLRFMACFSRTSSMSDGHEKLAAEINDYLEAFKPADNQVGAIFRVDGELVGMDVFSRPELFAEAFAKLLRGNAMQAQLRRKKQGYAGPDREFVEKLARAEAQDYKSVGLGRSERIDLDELVGGGLVNDDELVHLCAFPRIKHPA